MSRRGIRRALAAAGALALVAASGLYRRGGLVLDALDARVERAEAGLASRLAAAGVAAYWDFDALRPRELIGRSESLDRGTRRVSGRFGWARSFLPGEHGVFRTQVPLAALGDRFTFSCWLRVASDAADQRVFEYLALRAGRPVVQLPGQDEITGPALPVGRFVHLAFTVDASGGAARLFVDGAGAGEVTLRPPRHPSRPLSFGQEPYAPPPSFTLDEASVWNRPLSDAEVSRLAGLRRSLADELARGRGFKVALARSARESFRAFLLAGDLCNPFLHESRILGAGLPSYALALSRGDARQFNKFSNQQRENGLTAPGRSRARRVELIEGGRSRQADMELRAGEGADPAEGTKRTFTLAILDEEGEPERTVLVRPIEASPYLLEVLAGRVARASAIPAAAPELCTVSVNGTFEGIHLCADVARDQGPIWLGAPGSWQALLRRAPAADAELLAQFDGLAASLRGALASDRKSPLTSREVLRELGRQRRLLEAELAGRAAPAGQSLVAWVVASLREDQFLGANPHPTLVVGDLDLSARMVNGAQLSFESLTPAVLASDGRVTPPAGAAADALLRITVRSGPASGSKQLRYTVLPSGPRLPILVVQSAGEPPAEEGVRALTRIFGADGRGGPLLSGKVRLRGNTSLARSGNQKKYYRVVLERPSELPGLGRTRRLLLTSNWRDATLLREHLSYDLFRAFSAPGRPRYAPHVQPVELVVNGDYKGVYNLTDRVDADLLELGKGPGAALYKAMGSGATFKRPVHAAYAQKVPDWRDGEHWGPFDELLNFIGGSAAEAFREGVERALDVDNVIDFEILLAVTGNFEGRNFNLYLARKAGPGAPFFIAPWDYDMTFYHDDVATNSLIERLHGELPRYSERVLGRWRALRAGVLADAAVAARIDALAAQLGDAAARNDRRWPRATGEPWQAKVAELRSFVIAHLRRLDGHFVAKAAPRR